MASASLFDLRVHRTPRPVTSAPKPRGPGPAVPAKLRPKTKTHRPMPVQTLTSRHTLSYTKPLSAKFKLSDRSSGQGYEKPIGILSLCELQTFITQCQEITSGYFARSGDVAKDTLFFSFSLTDTHLNNLSGVNTPFLNPPKANHQRSTSPQGSAHLAIGRQQHPKSASRAIFDGSNAVESPEEVTGEEEIQSFFSSRMTYRNLPIHEVGFGRFHDTWVGLHFHVFKTDSSR
ncbi:uncharacterized protein CLUP02_07365 [Colletotrichum lupini]|uniref:Uncharacterized protein n=1 Tax=Colletotrichum lupini TaxID=145971 RepID=A0A9Q8WFW7_9PEZI|nr:uncharacterized protein CLUP02_07365 [Colletotrichum lupini]UQC81879.1 hypothetical protein CLUP02_07365 [Colletotrichum lupini]